MRTRMLLAVLAAALVMPAAAQADYSCAYDSGSSTVTVTRTGATGHLRLLGVAIATVDSSGAVTSVCSTATTANTNTIKIVSSGAGTDLIDLSGGAFLHADTSEIKFEHPGPGTVQILGTSAADHIVGGTASIDLTGDGDADLTMAAGTDVVIDGAAGDDVLKGPGTLRGGPGSDSLTAPAGATTTFDYSTAAGAVSAFEASGTTGGGDGDNGTDTYTVQGLLILRGSTKSDTLAGTDGDDTIFGGGGQDTINGGAGNDTLTLEGTEGGALDGGTGNDLLIGSAGNDTLHGSDGNDTLAGHNGDDLLFGDGGDDIIDEGGFYGDRKANGADAIHGDDGNDTVLYADPTQTANGKVISRDDPVTVVLDPDPNDGAPGEGDLVETENVVGTAGDDTLLGDDAANRLYGFKGQDVITGKGGDDQLFSGGAPASASDGADTGRDIISDTAGHDKIRALGGNDIITTSDADADDVSCGDGTDSETGDPLDTIAADCENVTGRAATVNPTPTPGPSPVATPTPTPKPTTKAPTFATVVTLPSANALKSCASRRKFRIHLKAPKGDKVASALITLNGKTVKKLAGKKVTSTVDLRGLPKGTFTVKITLKLASKKTLKGSRTYHTCVASGKKK